MSDRRGLPTRAKMRTESHFVDELEARHGEPLGKLLPTSSLEPDPEQPRAVIGDLDDLVASIREHGILEPVLARPNPAAGDGSAPLRIVSGERRWRAACEAELVEVPVILLDLEDREALEVALIENLHRKDLTPFEEAEGCRALLEQFDLTHEQVARRLGKSRTVITEALALLEMPPRVRDAAQALGVQAKSALREVLKAPDEATMLAWVEQIAEDGLSRDDLRRQTQRTHRGRARSTGGPFVFRFRPDDKRYSLSLKFRSDTVERTDLIQALEEILTELREAEQ